MHMIASRKGYYFIIDAILGILILSVAFVFLFSTPVSAPNKSRAILLANDVLSFLATNKIEDINDPYAGVNGTLWGSSDITNSKNTLMQQIGEFYYHEKYGIAANFISVVIRDIVPPQFNVEIVVEGRILYPTSPSPYSKESSDVTVITKTITFGEDKAGNVVWGPYSFEVTVWE